MRTLKYTNMKNISKGTLQMLLVLLAVLLTSCESLHSKAIEAISSNNMAELSSLLKNEDFDWQHSGTFENMMPHEYPLLEYACEKGTAECVSFLLQNGARPNDADEEDKTPLCLLFATGEDSYETVKVLLENDILPAKKDSPLSRAKSIPMADLLMQYGASPLDSALQDFSDAPIVKVFSDDCFYHYVNVVGYENLTKEQLDAILRHIFHQDQKERLAFLFECGLDVNYKLDGKTLYETARKLRGFEGIEIPQALGCLELIEKRLKSE